jgi:hypothetical protein
MEKHECHCASLVGSWPKCGETTWETWSPGCDAKTLQAAMTHLGFETRLAFIDWAAQRLQGRPAELTRIRADR